MVISRKIERKICPKGLSIQRNRFDENLPKGAEKSADLTRIDFTKVLSKVRLKEAAEKLRVYVEPKFVKIWAKKSQRFHEIFCRFKGIDNVL